MDNKTLITGLTARNIERVKADMERGYSYTAALSRAKEASIAGPAVWQAVEAHFADAETIGYESAPAAVATHYTPEFTSAALAAIARTAAIGSAMGANLRGFARGAA